MVKIVLTGGGTYGHVSPLQPIIEQLREVDNESDTLFIGMKGDRFSKMIEVPKHVDSTAMINSGKYRRYPDEPRLKRMFDFKTNLLNIRDLLYVAMGVAQSLVILKKYSPDVIFGNGGHVSVPVGWAARILNIPMVIHESDALPGIANKLLAEKSAKICLGMPVAEGYGVFSDPNKTVFTGIPIRKSFKISAKTNKGKLRAELGLDKTRKTVAISGGSQGAGSINNAIVTALPVLLQDYQIIHITGDANLENVERSASDLGVDLVNYHPIGFTDIIDKYFAAADLVVTRASATTFSELAVLAKPTILIPAPHLSDQIENAQTAAKQGAAAVVEGRDAGSLVDEIKRLLADEPQLKKLAKGISVLAKPDSDLQIAELLMEVGRS